MPQAELGHEQGENRGDHSYFLPELRPRQAVLGVMLYVVIGVVSIEGTGRQVRVRATERGDGREPRVPPQ
jgi:hypothetical protein